MNKSDFLAKQMPEDYFKVGQIRNAELNPAGIEIRQKQGMNWYVVEVYEKQKDKSMIHKWVSVYVADEGTENEEAFYGDKAPEKLKSVSAKASKIETNPELVVPKKSFLARLLGR
jgi:hypothetical protein